MSEEKETSDEQKQSALKDKLEQMGVMRDEHATQVENKSTGWKGKLPVVLVVFVAIIAWWWLSHVFESTDSEIAESNSQSDIATYSPPPSHHPSIPTQPNWDHSTGQRDAEAKASNPNAAQHGYRPNPYGYQYGPPPGWRPYAAYPPPPPAYYGHFYYRQAPRYYANPYYRGYYGAPIPQHPPSN